MLGDGPHYYLSELRTSICACLCTYSMGLAHVGGHRKHLTDVVTGHHHCCLFEIRNVATG